MTTMNAIEITAPGGPEVLQSCVRPRPVPNADQVILQVAYAGVNRPDALQRAGLYNPPAGASDLPGLEASGTVVEVGKNVAHLTVGDRVCALLPGGICCNTCRALLAHSCGAIVETSGLFTRNVFYGLVKCDHAWRVAVG